MSDGSITGHLGMSRSGKTFALMRRVERSQKRFRFLVYDRLHEWRRELQVKHALVDDRDGLEMAIAKGHRTIVFIPQRERWDPDRQLSRKDDPAVAQCAVLADYALDNAMVLVLPEIHRVAPTGIALPGPLDEIAGAYRHYRAGLWYDSQRPVSVHLRIREQTETMRIFAIAGRRDLQTIEEWYPGSAAAALRCSAALANGIHGWHIAIDPRNPAPPYPVRRFDIKGNEIRL